MKHDLRTEGSVVSDEPLVVYAPQGGYYCLKGTPRKYQGMLETIKVLFPHLEVRIGFPEDLGSKRVSGVVNPEGTGGIQFVLHENIEGREYDLAEHPEDFAAILCSIAEWQRGEGDA